MRESAVEVMGESLSVGTDNCGFLLLIATPTSIAIVDVVASRSASAPTDVLLRWPTYVLGQLWRRGLAEIDEALAAEGLSLRDYVVLVRIDQLPSPSQQQVADRVGVDRSDFVKILDRLQSRGLIGRERDAEDRRRHLLSLTDVGRAAMDRATAVSGRSTTEFFAELSPSELVALHRLALKALGEDPALAKASPAGDPDGS